MIIIWLFLDFEVVSPPLSPRYILVYSVCYCYTLSAHKYYSIQPSDSRRGVF